MVFKEGINKVTRTFLKVYKPQTINYSPLLKTKEVMILSEN